MTVIIKSEETDVKTTHIDDELAKFSLLGRYYSVYLVLTFFLTLHNSISCSNYIFTAEKVSYRCKDERFLNNTCGSLDNTTDVCTEWVYDNPHSFVAEFQLACQEWKRTLVGTAYNFGYGAGLLIIGPLSDRLGRKQVIVIAGGIGAILGVARSFATNYWLFIAIETLVAAFGDVYSPAFILLMEMVPHDKRVLSKMLCGFGSSFAYVVLSLSAYLFPYWRTLLRVIYAPSILFLLYTFLLDESPRWLLSKGRKEEAVAVLENIARKSKVKVDINLLNNISNQENKKDSFTSDLKHTFTSGVLIKRFVICIIWWTTSSFVSYGLRINAVLLPGNKYIIYGTFTVVDFIARVGITYILIKFRRKIPLITSFIFAGIICIGQAFVPHDLAWLLIALFLVGKMMSTAIFHTTYLFTSEIFPTNTRNSMHALCSAIGRVGSVSAPQTPLLMVYWDGLPSLLFGAAALTAGLVTMMAPDIADDALPDTVRQAEVLGNKHKQNQLNDVILNDIQSYKSVVKVQ